MITLQGLPLPGLHFGAVRGKPWSDAHVHLPCPMYMSSQVSEELSTLKPVFCSQGPHCPGDMQSVHHTWPVRRPEPGPGAAALDADLDFV
jgi:hypothetical protein